MLQTLFYVSRGGDEIGPLSIEDIRHQLEEGRLQESDYLYVEEKEDWIPLGTYLAEEHENKTPVALPAQERRQSHPPEAFSLLPKELHEQPEIPDDSPSSSTAVSVLPEAPKETAAPPTPHEHTPAEIPTQPDEITQDTKTIPQEFVLREGTAEVILEQLRPGRIEVMVALDGDRAEHREELKVMGGEPHEIKIHLSQTYRAGDEKSLNIEIVDEYGEPCSDFNGSLSFQLDQEPPLQVTLHGHKTKHVLECCRAGEHVVKIKNVSPSLKHTAEFHFNVEPGEPTTLKVQAEGTLRAGGPRSVKIQAFDSFGNLATSYDGPLKVEVLEHPNTARGSGEPALRIMPAPKKGA